MFKGIFTGVLVVIAMLSVIFSLQLFGLGSYKFFAPKYRAIDNQVFKESEQYNDGMANQLDELMLEYQKADDTQKQTIRAVILHRFASYDVSKLSPEQRAFYYQLKRN